MNTKMKLCYNSDRHLTVALWHVMPYFVTTAYENKGSQRTGMGV